MQSKYNKVISPGIYIIYWPRSCVQGNCSLMFTQNFCSMEHKEMYVRTEQGKKDETRTVLCVIAQRHLKTFIEEYLGSTQIFNHSVPSLLVVNLYSQGFIVENTEKAISFHSLFRAASFSLYLRAHTRTGTWITRFVRDLQFSPRYLVVARVTKIYKQCT